MPSSKRSNSRVEARTTPPAVVWVYASRRCGSRAWPKGIWRSSIWNEGRSLNGCRARALSNHVGTLHLGCAQPIKAMVERR
jgi:hypothetical protein